MKTRFIASRASCRFPCAGWAVAALAVWMAHSSLATESTPSLTVAVFDFESKDESLRDLGPKVATLVNAQLSTDPLLVTVERTEVEKVLSELELGLSGTLRPDSTAKAGQWLGAKVLVTGRVFKAGSHVVAVTKIISTETSRVYGELARVERAEDLTTLSDELAQKIRRTLHEKHETLLAPARSPEQRLESLVRSLENGPRPTVSVHISENHIGAPSTDPAAETEWIRVLQRAGFTVQDRPSTGPSDLTLSGEAFSTFGLRKGNLIACRARIEIRIHETRSGRLRLADRQTSVALDIAEPIAAKAALQEAALTLAERVLPRMTP